MSVKHFALIKSSTNVSEGHVLWDNDVDTWSAPDGYYVILDEERIGEAGVVYDPSNQQWIVPPPPEE